MSWLRSVLLGTANAPTHAQRWTVLQVRTWAGSPACLPLLPCWCTAEAEFAACLPWPVCVRAEEFNMLARVPGEFFWLLTLCFEVYSFKPFALCCQRLRTAVLSWLRVHDCARRGGWAFCGQEWTSRFSWQQLHSWIYQLRLRCLRHVREEQVSKNCM